MKSTNSLARDGRVTHYSAPGSKPRSASEVGKAVLPKKLDPLNLSKAIGVRGSYPQSLTIKRQTHTRSTNTEAPHEAAKRFGHPVPAVAERKQDRPQPAGGTEQDLTWR